MSFYVSYWNFNGIKSKSILEFYGYHTFTHFKFCNFDIKAGKCGYVKENEKRRSIFIIFKSDSISIKYSE